MAEQPTEAMMEPQKPSFLKSTFSGMKGWVKGLLAGGAVGVIAGGLIGAVAGLIVPGAGEAIMGALSTSTGVAATATTASIVSMGAIGGGAAAGAALGGAMLAGVGATAGTLTGVVQSRDQGQVQAEDVVNVAKISYAQGMGMGQQMGREQAAHEAQTHFRDKIMKERAARGQSQQQMQ